MSIDIFHFKPFIFPTRSPDADTREVARPFQLQQGEIITITGVSNKEHLFLVSGEVVVSRDRSPDTIIATGGQLVRPFNMPEPPVSVTVSAKKPSIIYHVDADNLVTLLLWSELKHILYKKHKGLNLRADQLASTPTFRNLPEECVIEAISRMQVRDVKADEIIYSQDDEGDEYFLIDSGYAEVWMSDFPGEEALKVNELGPGDGFGEYALVSEKPRKTTIKMATDGRLMVLDKTSFVQLLSFPVIKEISPEDAAKEHAEGAVLLDIRYEEEHEILNIPGAILMPMSYLAKHLGELDRKKHYVVFCRSGHRSLTATLILKQNIFDAVSMKGGILEWPYETDGFEGSIKKTG